MNMLKLMNGMSKLLTEPCLAMHSRSYAVAKRKMIRKEYFVYTPKMKSRYKGNPYPKYIHTYFTKKYLCCLFCYT